MPTFEALQSTSTNDLQETNTSYKQKPYSPASTPAAPTYTYPSSALSDIQDTSSPSDIVIMQPSGTGTSTYVPTGSSYLNTVYPGWGRCSGGRCSAMTQ
ncbi:MAG: hypothetical protein NT082_06030 [Chloroflexi bacterium]|nr:hypothetical protein [Chloroflexota bacterium]